jgi:membrane protein implicated in regulation of membrane protease activity
MNKYLYSRMMYSMAYVCAVAILAFAYLGIPNDLLIAFAIACLVAGGYLSASGGTRVAYRSKKERLTSLEEEMKEARRLAATEK